MEYHPHVKLFPPMLAEERETLKQDIAANGIHTPIILCEGKILDGRHRYEAAVELGMPHSEIPFRELAKNEDPMRCALSANFHRRHLSASQRAMVAARLPASEKADSKGQEQLIDSPPVMRNVSLQERAEKLNVSTATVMQALKVLQTGAEDIIEAADSGEIAVSDAALIADRDHAQQIAALLAFRENKHIPNLKKAAQYLDRKQRQQLAADAAQKYEHTERCKIFHCSIEQLSEKIDPGSVDAILTDPPYPAEFLDCWDQLGEFAMKVLKPGGTLAAMSGQTHFADVCARLLRSGLKQHWVLCYSMPGAAYQSQYRAVSSNWKPVIWMTKGSPGDMRWTSDVISAPKISRQENYLHEWQQQEQGWQMLTDALVSPGDIVCDPFLGSGTSAVCALKAGCVFVGCDTDLDSVNLSKERTSDV